MHRVRYTLRLARRRKDGARDARDAQAGIVQVRHRIVRRRVRRCVRSMHRRFTGAVKLSPAIKHGGLVSICTKPPTLARRNDTRAFAQRPRRSTCRRPQSTHLATEIHGCSSRAKRTRVRHLERTLDRDETISARRGKTRIARWMLRIFGEVSPTRHAGVLRAKGVGSNARTGSE